MSTKWSLNSGDDYRLERLHVFFETDDHRVWIDGPVSPVLSAADSRVLLDEEELFQADVLPAMREHLAAIGFLVERFIAKRRGSPRRSFSHGP